MASASVDPVVSQRLMMHAKGFTNHTAPGKLWWGATFMHWTHILAGSRPWKEWCSQGHHSSVRPLQRCVTTNTWPYYAGDHLKFPLRHLANCDSFHMEQWQLRIYVSHICLQNKCGHMAMRRYLSSFHAAYSSLVNYKFNSKQYFLYLKKVYDPKHSLISV